MSALSPRESRIAIASVVVALVALAFGNVINNDPGEEGDVVAFVVLGAVTLLVALLIFGRVVPRAKAAPAGDNRPAKVGLVMSVLGFLSVAVFWSGLPWVLGTGGALLGWAGEERSGQEGRRGMAIAALVIGALAVAITLVGAITDETG